MFNLVNLTSLVAVRLELAGVLVGPYVVGHVPGSDHFFHFVVQFALMEQQAHSFLALGLVSLDEAVAHS